MRFTEEQSSRYSRHMVLPEVGARGQMKISTARVFIVGMGGLGSPVALYLAAAGVGRIGMIDDDRVELSNLQRQIVHSARTVGLPKVVSAREAIAALNPGVEVRAITGRLTRDNILDVISEYDIVVDGSDNFPTRYLVNDACVSLGKPLVSGAILRFEGQVTTVVPREGHCYRCLFEEQPPRGFVQNCQEAGILGMVSGVIGSIQAGEVLKLILGKGSVLKNELLIYNALTNEFKKVRIPRNPSCPSCGEHAGGGLREDYAESEVCNLGA